MNFNWDKYTGVGNALACAILGFGLIYASTNWMIAFSLLLLFPYITLWVSDGWRWTAVSYLLTGVASYLFWGIGILPLLGAMILASSVLGWMTDRKYSNWKRIAGGSICLLIVIAGLFVYAQSQVEGNIIEQMQTESLGLVENAVDNITGQMSMNEVEQIALTNAIVTTIKQMFAALPALLAVMSMIVVIVNLMVATSVLKRSGVSTKAFSLANLRLDRKFLYGAGAIVVFVVVLYVLQMPQADQVRLNVIVFLGALAVINGMGFADWVTKNRFGTVARFLGPILILGILRIWGLYAAFGIADVFLDLRQRWKALRMIK